MIEVYIFSTGVKLSLVKNMYKQFIHASRENDCIAYSTHETSWGDKCDGVQSQVIKGAKLADYSFVLDVLRKTMGKTLTLVDSSISNEKQNKAMKDIIRSIYSDEMTFVGDMMFDQKELDKLGTEAFEKAQEDGIEPEQVSIEDALGVE